MKLSKREKRILAAANDLQEARRKVDLEQATINSCRKRHQDIEGEERATRDRFNLAKAEEETAHWALYREVTESGAPI